ncbi:MAG: hypothetical protein JWM93_1149 [Frankiales bacterium]|nr:hypothetical protein [Frankiales bacterium]
MTTVPDPFDDAPGTAAPGDAAPGERLASTRRMVIEYTVLRLGMFLGVAAVMLTFVRGRNGFFIALIVAAIVSGIASYFLLQRQRAPLAVALDRRLAASRHKSASEDDADDALRREAGE